MGLYSRRVFPRLTRWVMSQSILKEQRTRALADAHGEVLEVGFGPGLNLPFYPSAVDRLTGIDVNAAMLELVAEAAVPFPFRCEVLNGEQLPFREASFDCAVSTWTLCSIRDVRPALGEIRRVLRPGGLFLFVEHGLCPEPPVQRWQHWLTPLQRRIGGGCHLNRDIAELIETSGFEICRLERFYLKKTPRFLGYTYRGTARPSPSREVNRD